MAGSLGGEQSVHNKNPRVSPRGLRGGGHVGNNSNTRNVVGTQQATIRNISGSIHENDGNRNRHPRHRIDPAPHDAGWGVVEGSRIRRERV